MELIRGLHNLRDRHRPCVVSIGNFDGFHRGHQALVARLLHHARVAGAPAAVQTFEPTPREFFAPDRAPGRVATLRDKLCHLEAAGVERVVYVRFDRRFAALPPERFVEDILVARLGARAVIVGDDFRFGAGRAGDVSLLQRLGERHGFVTEAVGTVLVDGERASSTALRAALAVPDLDRAARLLGRPYRLRGRVRRGLQLGRRLGMPTVNVYLRRRPALQYGVYVVRVRSGDRAWDGVANIGERPTLDRRDRVLEAHLFGEAGTLYGALVEIEFRKFLRAEQRFESLEALGEQMRRDGEQATQWLKRA